MPEAPLGMGSAYTNPHELLGIFELPGAVKDPAFAVSAMEAPLPAPKPPQLADYQAVQAAMPSRQSQPIPLVMAPPLNSQPYLTLGHAPTTHYSSPPPVPGPSSTETDRLLRELSGQVEQLRNDFFSAATTISALRDRVERLENRGPEAPSNGSAEVAALRADFEAWIAQHLETTVEHCMRRVWARASMQQPAAVNAPST